MSVFGDFKPIGSYDERPETYSHPADELTGETLEETPEARSLSPFLAVMVLFFMLLAGRLLNLQVAQGEDNLKLAEGNRIRSRAVNAPRGLIVDQNNQPLLKNIVRYDLVIVPGDLPPKKADRELVYKEIRDKLKIDMNDAIKEVEKAGIYSLEPIFLESNLTLEKALAYQVYLKDTPGVSVSKQPVRVYPTDKGLGHVLGYIGKISEEEMDNNQNYKISDWIGKTGLEKVYETDLRGSDGQDQSEIDAQGRLQRIIASQPPKQGNNLHLHLDLPTQEVAYRALDKSVKDNEVSKGAAVAINPKTGGIYSYVSYPDYNQNYFVNGDKAGVSELFSNKDLPLLNRVISGTYPPGSVIKPVYAAAALEEKVIDPNFQVETPPEIKIGQFVFPDWKDHGVTDVRRAIAESNNIFFYGIAGGWEKIKGLGIKKMDEHLINFGFGQRTEIDLPGEVEGFVPTPEWKKEKKKESWYIGDTYHLGIGQGDLTVTPMQIAVATATIVNDGRLVKPVFADRVETVNGKNVLTVPNKVKSDVKISKNNFQVVREGMKQTVEYGSARVLSDMKKENGDPLAVAGKTGTAQIGLNDKTHAWFVAFAPYDDPRIVVTVLVENGGEGYTAALPVAREMLQTFFRNDNPAAK